MNGGLLMLAGHAIYQDGVWHGGHPNEERAYEQHVRDAFRIYAEEGYDVIVLSGGRSRPHLAPAVTHSEAQGMRDYAVEAGVACPADRILLEGFARDSFENLFFSLLCYHRQFGEWPSRVGAVSWKFKALRYYLIACGLRLAEGRFRFFGSGDPHGQAAIERLSAASVRYDSEIARNGEIIDPLHRNAHLFAPKRAKRMPAEFTNNCVYLQAVKDAYGEAAVPLIDMVEAVEPGPAWRTVPWPWTVQEARGLL